MWHCYIAAFLLTVGLSVSARAGSNFNTGNYPELDESVPDPPYSHDRSEWEDYKDQVNCYRDAVEEYLANAEEDIEQVREAMEQARRNLDRVEDEYQTEAASRGE